MTKKFIQSLRALFLLIPLAFVIGSALTSCGSGDGFCSGTVTTVDETQCTDYQLDNGCSSSSFDPVTGECDVEDCAICEDDIDDGDAVIDVDDFGFDDDF